MNVRLDRARQRGRDAVRERLDTLSDAVSETIAEAKPKLRGWLHAASVPLIMAAGIVLIALAPSGRVRIGDIAFTLTALLLFGVWRSTTAATGVRARTPSSSGGTTPTSSC